MAEQYIKDFYGKIIARIEIKPNGDKIIRDFYGKQLGSYDARTNTTRDFYGKTIAQGGSMFILFPREC